MNMNFVSIKKHESIFRRNGRFFLFSGKVIPITNQRTDRFPPHASDFCTRCIRFLHPITKKFPIPPQCSGIHSGSFFRPNISRKKAETNWGNPGKPRESVMLHLSDHFNDIFIKKSEVGGCSTGKSFRFVRACVRAVWLPSGIGSKVLRAGLFPFPFWLGQVVGFFLCWPGWSRGAFPFPFWARELSLFPSPTPQTSYPTLVGLIGTIRMLSCNVREERKRWRVLRATH